MPEHSVYRWHDKIACRNIGEETVIVGIENNEVHLLNEVGAFLWNKLEQGANEATLLERVLETYEIDDATARADVREFLDALESKKLIVASAA